MLVIRLQRTGRRNFPAYRLVVAEKARPVKGKFKEILGHYLPTREPIVFEFNTERIEYWISNGAIPSNTAARILKNAGVKNLDKYIMQYTKKKKRSETEGESVEAPPAEAPAEEAKKEKKEEVKEDKPAEETKKEEPEEKKEEEKAPEAKEEETTEEPGDKEEKKD